MSQGFLKVIYPGDLISPVGMAGQTILVLKVVTFTQSQNGMCVWNIIGFNLFYCRIEKSLLILDTDRIVSRLGKQDLKELTS